MTVFLKLKNTLTYYKTNRKMYRLMLFKDLVGFLQ